MLFLKGGVFKTNVILQDNEFEYYRLIGEAYNSKLLERAKLSKNKVDELAHKISQEHDNQFYTYIVHGIPKTMKHNPQFDVKHGYSKQVYVHSAAQTEETLYSTSCNKLQYNDSKERLE